MSFSKGGKSTAQTSTTTTTTSRNLNLQDLEGTSVADVGGDVNIIQTDMNAFDDASDLARKSLEVGESLLRESTAVVQRSTGDALDFGSRISSEAFQFGGSVFEVSSDALREVADAGERAQDFAGNALSQVRDAFAAAGNLVGDLFRDSLSFVGATQERQQESLGSTVTALNTIAREQSKSTDERVAEVSAGAQRNIVIIVGVVVAGLIGYGIFARGR